MCAFLTTGRTSEPLRLLADGSRSWLPNPPITDRRSLRYDAWDRGIGGAGAFACGF